MHFDRVDDHRIKFDSKARRLTHELPGRIRRYQGLFEDRSVVMQRGIEGDSGASGDLVIR